MIALVSLAPIAASAAPQALGLVATRDAMPLQCNGDTCVGFLSSFCLEEERMPPEARRAYKPAANSKITLIVETEDGRAVHLPGQEYLSFNVRLDFTSILTKVPLSRLSALSPARVSVHIGPLATLMPAPVPGDTGLHTPDEVKLVTGPYRRTGNRFFDDDPDDQPFAAAGAGAEGGARRQSRRCVERCGRPSLGRRCASAVSGHRRRLRKHAHHDETHQHARLSDLPARGHADESEPAVLEGARRRLKPDFS
jgi:hypothetical protein